VRRKTERTTIHLSGITSLERNCGLASDIEIRPRTLLLALAHVGRSLVDGYDRYPRVLVPRDPVQPRDRG